MVLRMDVFNEILEQWALFPTLDCNLGYRWNNIDKYDRGKAVVTSRHGLFSFIGIPFTLKTAPEKF